MKIVNNFRNIGPMIVDTSSLYGGLYQIIFHLRFLGDSFFFFFAVVVDFFCKACVF